jgi:peroxiredoxin
MTLVTSLFLTALAADPSIGSPAPAFSLSDLDGETWSLEALRGKTVVLEWFNPGCPFVVAAHEEGPLKDLAARSVGDDVVWLAINSGAPGKQGADPADNVAAREKWGMTHPVLLDPDGTVGKAYGAVNTPQLVVIDAKGTLQYWGALDNAPLNEARGERRPWTADAIAKVKAGEKAKPAKTKPWGCSVKY